MIPIDAARLRHAYAFRGWSQDDLADKAMCSRRTVERVLAKAAASPPILRRLCNALKIEPETLVACSRTVEPAPPPLAPPTQRGENSGLLDPLPRPARRVTGDRPASQSVTETASERAVLLGVAHIPTPAGRELGSEPQPPRLLLTVSLDLTVWKYGTTGGPLSIEDAAAVPLQAGDSVLLEIRLSRPAHIYALQLEAGGGVAPLYPWRECDWERRGTASRLTQLDVPQPDEVNGEPLRAELTAGPAGLEAFVVLAREEPLGGEESEHLRALFGGWAGGGGGYDPLRGVRTVGGDDGEHANTDRARMNLAAPIPIDDPVTRVERLLRAAADAGLAAACRGICYPFAGAGG